MDLYVRLALNVLLELVKDRRGAQKFYPALAKLYLALRDLSELDSRLMAEVTKRDIAR